MVIQNDAAQLNDEQLLDRYAANGDQQAFNLLYEKYDDLLKAYLYRHCGDSELVDDLCQQTWLKVHTSHGSFRAGSGVRPWLYSIAMNALIDHKRADRPCHSLSREESRGEWREVDPEDTRFQRPDVEVEDNESADLLRTMLGNLRPGDRDAVEAVYVRGLSHSQAAAELNIPLGSLKDRIRRAVEELRDWAALDSRLEEAA